MLSTTAAASLVLASLASGAAPQDHQSTALDALAMQAFGLTDARVLPIEVEGQRGLPATLRLDLDGQAIELALEPQPLFAEGFQLLEDVGGGALRAVPFVTPATYSGGVLGDPEARAKMTWLDDGLWGRFVLADGEDWWLQPVGDSLNGVASDSHVLYRGQDVIPSGGVCGTDLLPNGGLPVGLPPGAPAPKERTWRSGSQSNLGSDPLFVAEVATDADFEYFQDWGSSTGVMNRITSVFNTVNLQYEGEVGLTHMLTTMVVRTTSSDPYTSNNASTLLNEFQSEWNANQTSIQRDVAHMFTGRNISGGTIGVAFLSVICSQTTGYGLVESDCCGSFACVTDLSAHELGHNWAADHCTCVGFTMNPFITCGNQFTPTQTVPRILSHRDSRTCLDGGPDPFAKFSATPRSGDAPLSVDFTDDSTGTGVSAWFWDFGDGNTSSQQSPTHVYTVPGTYDVSLTVTGSLGTYTRTSDDFVEVEQPFFATCFERNGTINPDVFTCSTLPILGTTWVTEVDGGAVGATGLSILFGYGGASPVPIPTSFGSILVDPSSTFFASDFSSVIGGIATHALPIPNDPSLEAVQVFNQVFLNGAGQLTNALDIELGK